MIIWWKCKCWVCEDVALDEKWPWGNLWSSAYESIYPSNRQVTRQFSSPPMLGELARRSPASPAVTESPEWFLFRSVPKQSKHGNNAAGTGSGTGSGTAVLVGLCHGFPKCGPWPPNGSWALFWGWLWVQPYIHSKDQNRLEAEADVHSALSHTDARINLLVSKQKVHPSY